MSLLGIHLGIAPKQMKERIDDGVQVLKLDQHAVGTDLAFWVASAPECVKARKHTNDRRSRTFIIHTTNLLREKLP
jgi:hypothetical protein